MVAALQWRMSRWHRPAATLILVQVAQPRPRVRRIWVQTVTTTWLVLVVWSIAPECSCVCSCLLCSASIHSGMWYDLSHLSIFLWECNEDSAPMQADLQVKLKQSSMRMLVLMMFLLMLMLLRMLLIIQQMCVLHRKFNLKLWTFH